MSRRTSGAASANFSNDTSSTAVSSLDGVPCGVPSFSSIAEFFKRLKKNYQGLKNEKLRSF